MRAADIVDNKDFWMNLFSTTDFSKYLENKYRMAVGSIIGEEDEGVD